MELYTRYWVASMIRGVIAIIAAMGVLAMPQMISLVFLLPFAILISMMCLAVYGTVDSVIVLMTSFLIPQHKAGQWALRLQGIAGAVFGALLFFLVYDRANSRGFYTLQQSRRLASQSRSLSLPGTRQLIMDHGGASSLHTLPLSQRSSFSWEDILSLRILRGCCSHTLVSSALLFVCCRQECSLVSGGP